jgi:hypothetical protein
MMSGKAPISASSTSDVMTKASYNMNSLKNMSVPRCSGNSLLEPGYFLVNATRFSLLLRNRSPMHDATFLI